MAEPTPEQPQTEDQPAALEGGDYEIIRQRLLKQGQVLRERMDRLDERRREVFGSIELGILKADRVSTEHNCVPRDMVQLGQGRFLFGFNVRFGLKETYDLSDVFAIYEYDETEGVFLEQSLDPLRDAEFEESFKRLYKVYDKTAFTKFTLKGSNLYMVFRTGDRVDDIPLLIGHFLNQFAEENKFPEVTLTPKAMAALQTYRWPGNIRELRNFCENLVVLKQGGEVNEYDLDPRFLHPQESAEASQDVESPMYTPPSGFLSKEENEKRLLRNALVKARGNRTKAAQLLGISRRTLHRKLIKWPELDVR